MVMQDLYHQTVVLQGRPNMFRCTVQNTPKTPSPTIFRSFFWRSYIPSLGAHRESGSFLKVRGGEVARVQGRPSSKNLEALNQGSGFRVEGFGFRVEGFWVPGFGV